MAKNIVLCLDGTSNQVSSPLTNVTRLFRVLDRDATQLTYYDAGVGTLLDPYSLSPYKKKLRLLFDLATGISIRDNFCEAYSFLVHNYEEGDRVFMFGFSRGAFTARAVAGALHSFGLLRPEHENLIPYIWQAYSDDSPSRSRQSTIALFRSANRFKSHFSRKSPEIQFMGLWDTVAAFGLISRFRTLPYTRANSSIRVIRHAASIDEHRSCFGLNGFQQDVKNQDFREIWFAGVHSDVGGGFKDEESGLSKITLDWMVREAISFGLKVAPDRLAKALREPSPDPLAVAHDSFDLMWRLVEFLPVRAWDHDSLRYRWRWPNLFRRRFIPASALVHDSVARRIQAHIGYRPKNLPKNHVIVER
jgi:uncharacterized protein (DUF2235 family)